jgi:hypothetical protein
MIFKTMRLAACAVAALLFVSACSAPGGQAGTFAPPSAGHSAGKKHHVTLKIKIPKKSKASGKRRGHYISPATTQMTLDVETGCPLNCSPYPGFPITASLTPTSSGCTSTLTNIVCEISFEVPAGNYTASMVAEDAAQNVLSTAQSIAFTIIAGVANDIPITLSGVPHTIVATSLGQNNAYIINALDVDNNIIAGTGAPSFVVAHTSGTAVVLQQPVATSPNTFYATATAPGSAAFSVTAQTGAQCSGSFTLTSAGQSSTMFVSDFIFGNVTEYNVVVPPYVGPADNTIGGLTYATAIALNSAGDLFVAQLNGGVSEYAPPYTGAPIAALYGFNGPFGLACDSHDNLFVAAYADNAISEFAPPYTGAAINTIDDGNINGPQGITFDGSDNLYVANYGGRNVLEYAPPYSSVTTTLSSGLAEPVGLALDATGNLYIADQGLNSVLKSSPPFTSTTLLKSQLNIPSGIAIDPAGRLMVTLGETSGTVTSYAPPYLGVTPITLVSNLGNPIGVAFYSTFTTTLSQ